jgi:hypothetical protein
MRSEMQMILSDLQMIFSEFHITFSEIQFTDLKYNLRFLKYNSPIWNTIDTIWNTIGKGVVVKKVIKKFQKIHSHLIAPIKIKSYYLFTLVDPLYFLESVNNSLKYWIIAESYLADDKNCSFLCNKIKIFLKSFQSVFNKCTIICCL